MIGKTLGRYEITGELGQGGMGAVYRARDVSLGRDVAIKLIPANLTATEESLARFEREAKLLAALNHPGIAGLYGLEQANAVRFLSMELVDGGTLNELLRSKPLPLERTLAIALDIATALEAAHAQRIFHRDIKPSNIGLTEDGRVKLLDFGLAREESGIVSPTETTVAVTEEFTAKGTLLGTPAYMSPEQVRGASTDARTDIWSFGVVLHEMLARQRPFGGTTVTDTLSLILQREPDLDALPATTPAAIRRLLRRCLTKDLDMRLQSIGDARVILRETIDGGVEPESGKARQRSRLALAGWILAPVIAALSWTLKPEPAGESPPPLHADIPLPEGLYANAVGHTLALSPDGEYLAFVAMTPLSAGQDSARVFLRRLDLDEAHTLPGTAKPEDGAGSVRDVTFSPDGEWILYVDSRRGIHKLSLSGGAPVKVASARPQRGITWGDDGTIVFSLRRSLWQVPDTGGQPAQLLDKEDSRASNPYFLPGSRHLLFTSGANNVLDWRRARIEALDRQTMERRVLIENAADPRYVETGHLLFARGTQLMAVEFDPAKLTVKSEPIAVLHDIRRSILMNNSNNETGALQVAISRTGRLAYVPGSSCPGWRSQPVWVDREGNQEELPIPPDAWVSARISPDGRRALLEKNADGIWSWDFERELLRRQGTARDFSSWPEWLGSTDRFMFQGFQDDLQGIFVQTVDVPTNVEPVLLDHRANPAAGTLDENVVLLRDYGSEANPRGSGRLVACSLDGTMRELVPRPARYATLSPDQRWLAYQDNEGGADYRIFVRPYPGPGPSIQVSAEWAQGVAWSPDGSEIYYRTRHSEQEAMHAVPVRVDGGGLTLGRPRELFRGDFTRVAPNTSYDVASDGRFLMLRSLPNHPDVAQWERGASSIRIVDNWFTELQGKLGEPGS